MMERRPCVESLHQNGEEEINGINKTILQHEHKLVCKRIGI